MEKEIEPEVMRMISVRKFLGLTQKELAETLGYSLSHIKKIESGARTLSTDYFRTFCFQLGVSADFLLTDDMTTKSMIVFKA